MRTAVLSLLAAVASVRAITDVDVLQYALTLENLESTFYSEALAKFNESDFGSAEEFALFKQIAGHEATHVTALGGLIGANATKPCNYSFPYTDVQSFKALSMILEGVGTSAYLGAAKDIKSKELLTAAGSILAIEARHAAWLGTQNAEDPWSGAFETPLEMAQVVSLAAPFIVSCPASNPPLPAKPFPILDVSGNATNLTAGAELTMTVPAGFNVTGDLYAAFLTGITVETVPYKVNQSVTIPATVASTGMTYVVISTSTTIASDNTTVAGPAILMFSAYNMPSTNTTANMSMTASSTSASTTASTMSKSLNSTSAAEKTASSVLAASFAMIVGMMVFG